MGIIPEALRIERSPRDKWRSPSLIIGVPPEWARLCGVWYERSTALTSHRNKSYYFLLNVGRWLGHAHPEVALRPTGLAIWPGMPYRSSASGMEGTGAVPNPGM